MLAFELKYKITIKSKTVVINSFNERIESFTTYKTTRAGVKYASGNESTEHSQTTANLNLVFKIRMDSGITEDMIITYKGSDYNIYFLEYKTRRDLFIHTKKID